MDVVQKPSTGIAGKVIDNSVDSVFKVVYPPRVAAVECPGRNTPI